MALPKYRKSKSKTMMRRRSNDKRSLYDTSTCSNCGAVYLPHTVCKNCGTYKNKVIFTVKN